MLIKFEKNIPMPTERGFVNELRQMKVGDSFLIDVSASFSKNIYTSAKLAHVKVSMRLQPDKIHYRVWRIK